MSSIVIRDIESIAQMRAVEVMQREVWEIPDLDIVPVYHLIAAKESGGVLLGAFDSSELVGFVYGFVGIERGQTVHHSHMLAVRPEYRGRDLAFRLKLTQREVVRRQGIETMTWSFDPLRAVNAHFNFGKLGVTADRYYVDLYGSDAASSLHRNGTDRFWVSWSLNSPRVCDRVLGKAPTISVDRLPRGLVVGPDGEPRSLDAVIDGSEEGVVVEIPEEMGSIESQDPDLAREWRIATRTVLLDLLARNYSVQEFVRVRDRHLGCYVLMPNSKS